MPCLGGTRSIGRLGIFSSGDALPGESDEAVGEIKGDSHT